jgi:hypothetical protein
VEDQEGMAKMSVDNIVLSILMWSSAQKLCFISIMVVLLLEVLIHINMCVRICTYILICVFIYVRTYGGQRHSEHIHVDFCAEIMLYQHYSCVVVRATYTY